MRDEYTCKRIVAAVAGALMLGACQTRMIPAALDPANADNIEKARAAMAEAMGQGRLELGPVDPDAPTEIYVLPPPLGPLETHSVALPERFEVMMQGEACFAVAPETGTAHRLEGVACRPR